jgi:GNAT superfamily N-acetyltransferase
VIREATYDDVPDLVELGVRFIETGKYRDKIATNPEALAHMMMGLINNPYGLLLILEKDSRIIGMFGAVATLSPYSAEPVVMELFWYVAPESRGGGVRLLRKAENWAREIGAHKMIAVSHTSKVTRFIKKLGYQAMETHLVKAL